MKSRIFVYDGSRANKQSFEVQTNLSDDEAIDLLGGLNGKGFKADAAFEIHKMKHGYRHKENLVAWAFKMAEDAKQPKLKLQLSPTLLKLVAFRKPVRGVAGGDPYEVKVCGQGSQRAGHYAITDGARYPGNKFYGYATPQGEWEPTHKCPDSIKAHLCGMK